MARDGAVVRTLYNYPNLLLYITHIFKEKNFPFSSRIDVARRCRREPRKGRFFEAGNIPWCLIHAVLRGVFPLPTFQPSSSP